MTSQRRSNSQLLYGKRTAEEFLKAKPSFLKATHLFLSNNLSTLLQKRLLEIPSITHSYHTKRELDKLFPQKNHQGVIIKCLQLEQNMGASFKSSWKKYVFEKGGIILILDSIQDPANTGNILRSAEALGVKSVILTGKSCGLNETVCRVSCGSVLHLPVFQIANLSQVIRSLQKENFWICATKEEDISQNDAEKKNLPQKIANDPFRNSEERQITSLERKTKEPTTKKNKPIKILHYQTSSLPPKEQLALIIGNEGHGIQSLALQQSDFIISIQMQGKTESLNASSAAAILIDRLSCP